MALQIRDPVHNFIQLKEKESELIGTNAFQRLRRIRQLAFAHLVYPGALHTRFDHSLGVLHIASQMAETLLGKDDDAKRIVRLAALLHDIGHGPFSHVSEGALDLYADRSKLDASQKRDKIHELVTGLIIQNDSELVRLLGQTDCEKVVELLGKGLGDLVNRSLISGPLDADKQDYLLRDSLFCGVKYGVFDLNQLRRSLTVRDGMLMLRPDGVHAMEQYVLAKYYLTTNVYRHKVRLITDQMVVRAITLGVEVDEIEELRDIYAFDNTWEFVRRYTQWDDSYFLCTFGLPLKYQGMKCQDLLSRLLQRMLFKRVFRGKLLDFSPETRELMLKICKVENTEKRRVLEQAIAEKISTVQGLEMDPDCVIIHVFDVKSVKEMSRNDESSVLVDTSQGPVPFEDESALFASIQGGMNEEFVEIYAPLKWRTHPDRDKVCRGLFDPLMTVIEEHCRRHMRETDNEC